MADQVTLVQRVATGVCQRAFSGPEAIVYEVGIAPAVCDIASREISGRLTGASVLDVGCGGGRLARALSERSVMGVDPSPSQAKRFTRPRAVRGARGVAVQAGAQQLPFSDQSFDSVVSCCALKHWPDARQGLAECARVLRPSGKLVIVEIDGRATREEVLAFARRTRVPFGMRRLYTRFAMQTVVDVAPTDDDLRGLFSDLRLSSIRVARLEGAPFLIADASKA